MAITCKECKAENLEASINDLCCDCHRDATVKWREKMATRQDPSQFDIGFEDDPSLTIGHFRRVRTAYTTIRGTTHD